MNNFVDFLYKIQQIIINYNRYLQYVEKNVINLIKDQEILV